MRSTSTSCTRIGSASAFATAAIRSAPAGVDLGQHHRLAAALARRALLLRRDRYIDAHEWNCYRVPSTCANGYGKEGRNAWPGEGCCVSSPLDGTTFATPAAIRAVDANEVFHQLDDDETGIALLAGLVAMLHLAAAGLAGGSASSADVVTAGSAGTMPA